MKAKISALIFVSTKVGQRRTCTDEKSQNKWILECIVSCFYNMLSNGFLFDVLFKFALQIAIDGRIIHYGNLKD